MKFEAHRYWTSAIPVDWQWNRVSESFQIINGFPFSSENFNSNGDGLPLVRIRDILSSKFTTFYDGQIGSQVLVTNGDIVIGMDGDFNSCWWDRDVALLNQRVAALRPKANSRLEPRFAFYQVPFSLKIINDLTPASTVKHLSSGDIAALRLPSPDLPTQKRIADFLDRETARIDELIEKKDAFRSLIATLEETRFLARVTGQDLQGERVNSGVRWIGDLPDGWLAPKFTMVARQESGHTPSRKEPSYWIPDECIISWVSLADVWQLRSGKTVYLADTAEKISAIGMANSSARLLPAGTVVLSRTASVGFSGILAKPMATTQDFAAWICGPTIRPKFLYYVLRAMKPEFRRLMMGSTHQTIYMPDIRAFRTPLPPLAEQDRIIAELDASISSYRKVHERLTESVSMLREYRSALITAAVTGQIDVDAYERAGKTSATLDRIEEEMQA
ncbi:restriction endonuclease subunit S [Paracoccus beibuensis]|uniref:restriction endonuclease subunit S n=1 Tax=Paracoccus beibuensis TaxID=547602 RepID=UPI002240C1C6|nr:restriction endonuclease subunit S [Paracoccus beibuensis]